MAKKSTLLTSLVLLLASCVHSIRGVEDDDQRPVVKTQYGLVRGRVRQLDNGAKVNEFLGVPYAAPPVGDLRFKKTVKPENRNEDIWEADKMPPACPQYSDQPLPWYDMEPGQSEDCLYLNIWAPADPGPDLRPVKMYVHGGGWFEGGSNRMGYYGGFGEAMDTMDENGTLQTNGTVVVTVNYRLGALGFLASGLPDDAPGNMGLFDLAQAFEWVFYNIEYFGGQVSSVGFFGNHNLTLVGQGSGAIAVSLLRMAVTRISDSDKVVLHGASFLTLKALEGVDEEGDSYLNNLRLTNMLANALDCPAPLWKNRTSTIACLKGVESSRLVQAAASLSQGRGPPNVFLPQIKGPDLFFFYNPYKALNDYPFSRNLVLATFTTHEGSDLLTSTFPRVFGVFGDKDIPLSAACAKLITRKLLKTFPQSVADELLGDLDLKPTAANKDKVVQAIGDAYFNCPIVYYLEESLRAKYTNTRRTYTNAYAFMVEKQVYPPYNPWAPWMGSVGFDDIQIDFVHPDGQLSLKNQTYTYTDEQSEQARLNKKILNELQYFRLPPIPGFTVKDPDYGYLQSNGKLSEEKKSNFHKENCDILRPFFIYPEYKL